MQTNVTIDKLVHGGQGLAVLGDGKKVLVWGALPGEEVQIRIIKKRPDYVEAVIDKVLTASPDRESPRDDAYMSTSPWQIVKYPAENEYKKSILRETMERAGVDIRSFSFNAPKVEWHYRNKMEYSFYGDEQGLHLALFNRGSHRKQIVDGSSIAMQQIDQAARLVRDVLDSAGIRAGSLKTLVLRASQDGQAACALYVRDESFKHIKALKNVCKGIAVVYSNPKSPASVRTRDLYQYGDISLSDRIVGADVSYDVFSFFQVNLEAFDMAMAKIKGQAKGDKIIDLYSGVGTIGVAVGAPAKFIESDEANIFWAKQNVSAGTEVIKAASESALDHIDGEHLVVVDPPRAGLHARVVQRLLEAKPPKIIYLSCNPSTQARDIKLLEKTYDIQSIEGFNFFPKTPHIESLAILDRR